MAMRMTVLPFSLETKICRAKAGKAAQVTVSLNLGYDWQGALTLLAVEVGGVQSRPHPTAPAKPPRLGIRIARRDMETASGTTGRSAPSFLWR